MDVNYDTAIAYVQKFCGNQLRSKRYSVKLTEIYLVPTSEKARDPERYDENEDSDSECEITDQQVISDNSNLPLRRSKRSRKAPDWLATPEIERE